MMATTLGIPMANEIHEMNRTLGGLKASVESMTTMWGKQEKAATEGRQFLHDKFDSLRNDMMQQHQGLAREVTALSGRVDHMARDIADFKPSITAYNASRLRDEGAKHLGKIIWGGIMTAAGLTGWGIATLVHWLSGHP